MPSTLFGAGGPIDVGQATKTAGRSVPDVVLRERSGRGRTLRLTREALPFRPVKTGMRTRQDVTEHQGNVDATVQMLGPSWDPIELKGSWRNVWLGRNNCATLAEGSLPTVALNRAVELYDTFQSFWVEGQQLDFVWGGRVAYRVHIAAFNPTWQREEDIDWELTLTVVGPGLVDSKSEYSTEWDTVKDSGTWAAKVSAALATVRKLAKTVLAYEKALNNDLDRLDLLARQLDQDVRILGTVAELPVRLKGRFLATATTATNSWKNVCATINNVDAAYNSDGTPANVAANARTRAVIVKTGRGAQRDASLVASSLRRSFKPRIVKIVTVTEQTDLRRLSIDAYGTPDLWPVIAKENGITGSTPLTPGQVIYIPERPA